MIPFGTASFLKPVIYFWKNSSESFTISVKISIIIYINWEIGNNIIMLVKLLFIKDGSVKCVIWHPHLKS